MDLKIFLLSTIITFAVMVVLCLFGIRKGMKEIEKSIGEVLYMISMFIPVVILAMMMTYFQPYAFLCALIWVLILAIGNRILMLRGMNKDIDHETRTALSFFSMVFGLVFYILQAHVQGGDEYCKMADTIGALIIGFFVSLEVVLEEAPLKIKVINIWKGLKLKKLKRLTFILLIFSGGILISICLFEETAFYRKHVMPLSVGFIVGYILALVCAIIIIGKKNDYMKYCTDLRSEIFSHEKFVEYKKKIECFLGYTNKEKYDCVEAFLFYKAFTERLTTEEKFEADSTLTVCSYIQNEYNYFEKSLVTLRTARNENIYVLRKGRRRYCGDIMTSPWPLFKEFLRVYSGHLLEEGNVPKTDRERYREAGLCNNREMWLLYFLEQYHGLTSKEKRAMIPNEVRSFLANTYKIGAIWAIPIGCNNAKMRVFTGKSGKKENYDWGDLTLLSIYEWFRIHETDGGEARNKLGELFENDERAVSSFEDWLREFKNWNEFVLFNRLGSLVKKKGTGIIKQEYAEPFMFFAEHSYEQLFPDTKEEWLDMFKMITKLISSRG